MMIKKWFVFVFIAMLAGTAFASETGSSGFTPNLDKGTRVLEGAGTINVMGDDVLVQFAYGQLVADGIEVAMVAGLRDNDLYMSTELGVRAEYNFSPDSDLVPFLSAGIVWADVEADNFNVDTDAVVLSIGGGVKHFIRNDVAVTVSGNYLVASDDIFVDSEDVEVNEDELRILFSVRFYSD